MRHTVLSITAAAMVTLSAATASADEGFLGSDSIQLSLTYSCGNLEFAGCANLFLYAITDEMRGVHNIFDQIVRNKSVTAEFAEEIANLRDLDQDKLFEIALAQVEQYGEVKLSLEVVSFQLGVDHLWKLGDELFNDRWDELQAIRQGIGDCGMSHQTQWQCFALAEKEVKIEKLFDEFRVQADITSRRIEQFIEVAVEQFSMSR